MVKYLKMSLWLFGLYWVGELISAFLPFPLPGNLIGMLLLLALLCLKLIKLEEVEEAGQFFLENMSLFFVPITVSVFTSFALFKDVWPQILLICFVTTPMTLLVTGGVTKALMHEKGDKIE